MAFRRLAFSGIIISAVSAVTGLMAAEAPETVESYEIRWADGYSVSIDLMTDYIAVDIEYDRVSNRMKAQTKDLRPFSIGIAGREIAIARVDSEQERASFLSVARDDFADYLGVPVRAASRDGAPLVGIVTSEIIVRFNDDLSEKEIASINMRVEAGDARRGETPFENRYVINSSEGTVRGALQLAARYFEREEVVYAHPNFLVEKVSRSPDPLLPNQWHLQNLGQHGGTAKADARVVKAWETTKGSGITIAVIDPQGVQRDHEDLLPNRFENPGEAAQPNNGIDDDNNGFRDDWSGWNFDQNTNNPATSRPHGTAAAGVAAAACDNGLGGCGVAPEAKILSIAQGRSVLDDARAITYAGTMGADVISNSWGYPLGSLQRPTDAVEEAIAFVASNGRNGKGIVVVFAMTNENLDNFSGATPDISSLDSVIAVGRSTNQDKWGKSGFGDGMALLAPTNAAVGDEDFGCLPDDLVGTLDITTTDLMDNVGYNRGSVRNCSCNPSVPEIHTSPNYTACFGGTSSATPLVAGIAALVLSVNPDLTRQQVTDILIESADKIDTFEAQYSADTQGRLYSTTHGFGRVNAAKAVEMATATLTAASGTELSAPILSNQ